MAGILGILATAVLLVLWTANTRVEDLQRQHEALVEVAVDGTAKEISLHLDELRRSLRLFAESHQTALIAIAGAPDDLQRLADLARDVERAFPESFAHSLVDSAGHQFVEDFDGLIDEVCRETIAAFTAGSPGGGIAIHPNPSGYHFDLMTRVDLGLHGPGVFFISLGPELLTPLLETDRLPAYELLLLHREIDGLIELVDTGSRDSLDREFYLDAAEQEAIVYQTAVPGTRWSLAALPRSEAAIGSRVADIWQDNVWEILLLILIGALALWQLKRSADREVVQNRMLTAVNRAESRFIADDEPAEVFSDALDDVLALTRSEFGFLGEVVEPPDGEPYLRVYAIGHRGADHGVEAFLRREARGGAELRGTNTLLSRVIADAECVIDNDLSKRAHDEMLPGGHPPLRNFLGAPLFHGVRRVGMLGLANRRGGYDAAVLRDLQPMLRSCGNLFGAMRNSQQRVLAEAALQASETRERAVLQTVVDGIVTTDDRGVIESVNPAAERMFGYGADELIGQDIGLLVPDADRRLYMRLLRRFLSSGAGSSRTANRELIGRRRDGGTFSVELAVSRMDLGGQVKLTGLVRDVTRRKNSERVLRENTALQRAILDGANHSIIATDRDGTILVFNAGAQRMLGYSASEMVGQRTPAIIHDPVEVADRARELSEELGRSVEPGFEVFAAKVLEGGSDEREWSYI
ncbi:MAG: PAS domain S-box protein, partial [Chromatiales bacterium]